MDEQELSIHTHFADVTDPRKAWNQDHRLSDILVMALCGIICGADSWVSVAAFAEAKLPWCPATRYIGTRIASRKNLTHRKAAPHERPALPQQACSGK